MPRRDRKSAPERGLLHMVEIDRDWILESVKEQIALSGARLTERERDFLAEARWQSRRKSERLGRPRTTTSGGRKAKHDLIKRLRQGLKNLTIADLAIDWQDAWWKKSDVKKVLDKEALLDVVRIAVRHFGREYADPLLAVLKDVYRIGNEEIVVLRRP